MTEAAIAIVPDGPLIVQPIAAQIELSVVVPTFQESANIGLFLTALCEVLDPVLPGSYEIVVVDDDSPDGTLEIAAGVAAAHPQIRLARRPVRCGLATAVILGWQLAQGKVLATINTDFQHPPEIVVGMWKLVQGVDLVGEGRNIDARAEDQRLAPDRRPQIGRLPGERRGDRVDRVGIGA